MKEELRRLQEVHEEEVNSLKSHINALSTLINNSVETINEVLASRIDHQQEEASSSRSQINSLTTQMRSMERKVELNRWLTHNVTYSTSFSSCSGHQVLTTMVGTIGVTTTGTYSNNADCSWQISLEPGTKILLRWSYVEMEGCTDFVQVADVTRSNALVYGQKVCGSVVPRDHIVNSHSLKITFHSDHSVVYRGFAMTYEAVPTI
ncbi:membrane frizzled-related protein-like [Homarus americanus]|uniref:membrane frizzled-related protein-like n=1 Tax=Homarus americanus TaxID=6706 RepID=UPI001C4638C8|nr:membrane frizzled-related protein-like [Homarus americanus]